MRVMHRGKLVPRCFFEPEPSTVARKPACLECLDTGLVLERIDGDKPPHVVPCGGCREYCTRCSKHMPRGHKC